MTSGKRITFRDDDRLLDDVDALVENHPDFNNRSDVIRAALQAFLDNCDPDPDQNAHGDGDVQRSPGGDADERGERADRPVDAGDGGAGC